MVFTEQRNIKKEVEVPAKKEHNDAIPFRDVRFVTTKKGTEFLVVREGIETWLSLNYLDKIVENGRIKKDVRSRVRNGEY